VATSALFIATKYEEIYPPSGNDLLRIMQVTKFTYKELLSKEFELLTAIEF
jgi:hypothetical protein